MSTRDKRIDDYIGKAGEFARPILSHLRKLVHKACPEVEETIKWGFPHFDHKGILCSMAAFKQHCSFGFWKASLMRDAQKLSNEAAMGSFGRITTLKDLPADSVLIRYIQEAAQLNERGAKLPPKPRDKRPKELTIPDYFLAALKKNKTAFATFEKFSYSHKKEYVEWVSEAKTQETRNKRLTTTVEWLSEGKPRHWKYEKKQPL
jgi:uncharacterized protein YdeI (YjbR/CyaY-like superfamily)